MFKTNVAGSYSCGAYFSTIFVEDPKIRDRDAILRPPTINHGNPSFCVKARGLGFTLV